jgi:allophanate hydrolase
LRVAETDGHAIALEIWALSPAAFGRFVASIPSPLTIGTVALADGASVKGFLCEAEALRAAQDISHHGGWRAFMAAGEGADGA